MPASEIINTPLCSPFPEGIPGINSRGKGASPLTKGRKKEGFKGYVALISVLIVGVIGAMVVSGIILLGLSNSRTSFVQEQSFQAKTLADACMEEALQQIKDSLPFSGNGTLALGQGSCAYTVTNNGAQNRSVVSTGTVGAVVRRVSATLDKIAPSINITSWQEVQ